MNEPLLYRGDPSEYGLFINDSSNPINSIWLDNGRTLNYYLLKNGVWISILITNIICIYFFLQNIVEYRNKYRPLKIRLMTQLIFDSGTDLTDTRKTSTLLKVFWIYNIISSLIDSGHLRESHSPYSAPAILIDKKDKSYRLVVDYKKLNAITIKDEFPLPNMEETLQEVGGGYCYFSKLDLKSGFWQLPIDEKDRHKTAFKTPFGLYEWNVLAQ
ncbi:unnamed protein product, partial [Didymodactylos carnosus]